MKTSAKTVSAPARRINKMVPKQVPVSPAKARAPKVVRVDKHVMTQDDVRKLMQSTFRNRLIPLVIGTMN